MTTLCVSRAHSANGGYNAPCLRINKHDDTEIQAGTGATKIREKHKYINCKRRKCLNKNCLMFGQL